MHGAALFGILLVGGAACSDDAARPGNPSAQELSCSLNSAFVFSGGVPRDGIPALTDPPFVSADDPGAGYLLESDRVIGLFVDGQPLAVPHNILWWHEIVNLNRGDQALAITYCPLTGSSLVFDRSAVDGAEFGVSGILFQNNLMMYDRRNPESFWPQMMAGARCGPADGTELPMVAGVDITWKGWKEIYPETMVVSGTSNFDRNYQQYPYGSYESDEQFLFPMPIRDARLPQKRRVLGLADGSSEMAFPLLGTSGPAWQVATVEHAGEPAVVFWNRNEEAVVALRPFLNGEALDFSAVTGGIFDVQTGSRWSVNGLAVEGPLQGRRLEIVPEGFVAFWGAWVNFHPETAIWTAP